MMVLIMILLMFYIAEILRIKKEPNKMISTIGIRNLHTLHTPPISSSELLSLPFSKGSMRRLISSPTKTSLPQRAQGFNSATVATGRPVSTAIMAARVAIITTQEIWVLHLIEATVMAVPAVDDLVDHVVVVSKRRFS